MRQHANEEKEESNSLSWQKRDGKSTKIGSKHSQVRENASAQAVNAPSRLSCMSRVVLYRLILESSLPHGSSRHFFGEKGREIEEALLIE